MTGLDYSAGRPPAAAIRAAGYDFVVRYVGTPGRAKNITRAEYADLTSGGVAVALVYENRAGDALAGRAAGQAAARAARADADLIGFPRSRPIYFACDTDVVTEPQFRAVMDYLRGAADVLGGPHLVGVYGEYDVTTRARREGVSTYEWQTVAWSRGLRDQQAELFQRLGYVYIGSMAADANDRLRPDYGQHNYQQEDDMQPQDVVTFGRLGTKMPVSDWMGETWDGAQAAAAASRRTEGKVDALTAVVAKSAAPVIDYDLLADKVVARGGLKVEIDYAAMAAAVNDDAARRMES